MALEDALLAVEEASFPIDMKNKEDVLKVVQSCLQTKFTNQFGTLMAVSMHLPRECKLILRLDQICFMLERVCLDCNCCRIQMTTF